MIEKYLSSLIDEFEGLFFKATESTSEEQVTRFLLTLRKIFSLYSFLHFARIQRDQNGQHFKQLKSLHARAAKLHDFHQSIKMLEGYQAKTGVSYPDYMKFLLESEQDAQKAFIKGTADYSFLSHDRLISDTGQVMKHFPAHKIDKKGFDFLNSRIDQVIPAFQDKGLKKNMPGMLALVYELHDFIVMLRESTQFQEAVKLSPVMEEMEKWDIRHKSLEEISRYIKISGMMTLKDLSAVFALYREYLTAGMDQSIEHLKTAIPRELSAVEIL